MNKTLLKFVTIGAAATMLLAMLMISGCKQDASPDNTITKAATGTGIENSASGTQDLPPDQEGETSDTQDAGGVGVTENDSDIDVPVNDTPVSGNTNPQLNKPDEQDTEPTISDPQTDGKPIQPTQPSQSETEPKYSVTLKDWESMDEGQQMAYMMSFPSIEDYVEWLRWARAEDVDDGKYLEGEGGVVVIP